MSLMAIVALSLVGVATFAAYRNERIGSAVLVGCAALAAFYLLVDPQEDKREAPQAPPAPTASVAAAVTPGGEMLPRIGGRPSSLPSGA